MGREYQFGSALPQSLTKIYIACGEIDAALRVPGVYGHSRRVFAERPGSEASQALTKEPTETRGERQSETSSRHLALEALARCCCKTREKHIRDRRETAPIAVPALRSSELKRWYRSAGGPLLPGSVAAHAPFFDGNRFPSFCTNRSQRTRTRGTSRSARWVTRKSSSTGNCAADSRSAAASLTGTSP